MSGSPASASTEPQSRVLICGLNWLGDAVMSMPAIQRYRELHPSAHVSILVKTGLKSLWQLHPAIDEVISFDSSLRGTWAIAKALRKKPFDVAYIFPNSFRSALIPLLANIPVRIGVGHKRMLTQCAPRPAEGRHQMWEYFSLLDIESENDEPQATLILPPDLCANTAALLEKIPRPRVGLIPGAARGPSKQWPVSGWKTLAAQLAEQGVSVLVLGTPDDRGLGDTIAGDTGHNFAGKTSLIEFAALIQHCDAVVANDSGGMHLSTAVGTPVIALYGITDPSKTGPLGDAVVLQHSKKRSRDIPRESAEAVQALERISVEEILQQLTPRLS